MHGEPTSELIRAKEAMSWLGVDWRTLNSWAEIGLITRLPKNRPKGKKSFFSRTEIGVKILGHPPRVEERK